jgi:hypothetical protein
MNPNRILILGDLLAILIITLIGFASHGELGVSFPARIAATYFPLSVAWFLLAPQFGLFRQEIISNPREIWKPTLAVFFAVPLATVLRGLILNAPIPPIFVIVLSAALAFGLTLWRGIYMLLNRKIR